MQACLNLTGRSGFKKQPKRFLKIPSSFFDCVTLAGDIQFRAERHISIPFAFDNRCKLPFHHIYPNSPERTISVMAISTPYELCAQLVFLPNPSLAPQTRLMRIPNNKPQENRVYTACLEMASIKVGHSSGAG